MAYTNLPNTFLQLPEMGNLSKRPDDPYTLGTIGMIHTSKFKEICRVVIDDRENASEELAEILEGHRLEGILDNLEKDEVADFIRHVTQINKRKIGWEVFDDIHYRLNENYTPRWELPDLGFESGFREIFLTRVSWEPPLTVRQTIEDFLEEYNQLTGNQLSFKWEKNVIENTVWNYRDLFLLLNEISYLISEYKGQIDYEKYLGLSNQLKILFEENFKSKFYTIPQRISLIFLYVKGAIRAQTIDFNQIQILMDNSYTLIKQLDDELQKSYRLIFGYTYAIFAYYLFKSTSDLVIQRDLVAELLQDIYKPEEVDLSYWSRHLSTSKPHPLLFSIIFSGYYRLAHMIRDYAGYLPSGESQDELIGYYMDLIGFLKKTVFAYLKAYFKLDLRDVDNDTLVNQIEEHISFVNLKRLIFHVIIFAEKGILLEKEDLTVEEIDDLTQLISVIYNENMGKIHEVDLKIRKGLYPFEKISEQIKNEFAEKDSIILATSFEDEVIQIIGQIFSEVQERFKIRDVIDVEEYEILLIFVSSWFQHFCQMEALRYEAMMILSPLISICYIQLARGYYENNNLEAAYLSYFNSHYIVEMINDELVESKQSKESKLSDKFTSLIHEWNIDYILDTDYIKRISSNIDIKIRDRINNRADKSFSMGGMLQDEIVIGYLDLITKLETFLQYIGEGTKSVKEAVLETEIYDPPKENHLFRNNFFGYLSKEPKEDLFPIPIVRDIDSYSMAIKLYPIEVDLPGALIDIEGIFGKINKE